MRASVRTDPEGHHISTRGVRPSTRTQSLQEHTGVTGMFYTRGALRLKLFISSARTLLWSSPVNALLLSARSLTGPIALPGLGGAWGHQIEPGAFFPRGSTAPGAAPPARRELLGFFSQRKL